MNQNEGNNAREQPGRGGGAGADGRQLPGGGPPPNEDPAVRDARLAQEQRDRDAADQQQREQQERDDHEAERARLQGLIDDQEAGHADLIRHLAAMYQHMMMRPPAAGGPAAGVPAPLGAVGGGGAAGVGVARARTSNIKVRTYKTCDGDDWLIFRRHIRTVKEINEWDDERAKKELANAMDGQAARRVEDLTLVGQTFNEACDLYEDRFIYASDSQAAKEAFARCKQKDGESVLDWSARCRGLHVRAWKNMVDRDTCDALVHHFKEGIHNQAIYARLLLKKPATYSDSLKIAQDMESMCKSLKAKTSREKNGGLHAITWEAVNGLGDDVRDTSVSYAKPTAFDSRRKPKEDWKDNNRKSCWHCGKKGHLKMACDGYKAMMQGQSTSPGKKFHKKSKFSSRKYPKSTRAVHALGKPFPESDDWEEDVRQEAREEARAAASENN